MNPRVVFFGILIFLGLTAGLLMANVASRFVTQPWQAWAFGLFVAGSIWGTVWYRTRRFLRELDHPRIKRK